MSGTIVAKNYMSTTAAAVRIPCGRCGHLRRGVRVFGSGARPDGKKVEKHAELDFNIGLYFRLN
ncbi:hypothetical protein [Burkholderia stabilis]|uniref:hypothetical protein n=1 Tax=Burkholderia stabilis TaxID=95485 RepID=UPI0012EA7954|nr:hypothetical protein [Burkholderia stabilis]HDR9489577.1 hypothetical protein [Burkholderia stabilis]HDR9536394.1 hypothetical protein [Burkholderia stabilis]HDR9559924.1 hypothetical protein [Burkholderia stabilis]HDR9578363.1 hypothetical protein [Burkholderia stabilis]HDR9625216.1 hypothetical protein [Burkholderia stabilis]